ncbi:MAG: type II toxin-antitoxin system RelE/ParE family toxin [Sphingomonas sp.]
MELRNPDAAARMDQLFSDHVARLADFPMIGHQGTIVGTRELTPHRNYRLVYEMTGETVWILALIHAARQWPPVRPY